jgi:sugar/nucleoside kinase (ribokinase family)
VSIDLAVLTPTYLDYTFVGLEALPGPGEERFAGDMLRSPGGGGISAVAAARLGLATALIAPLGDDLAGRFVRQQLEDEGVVVGEPRGNRTPTTMVMPVGGERAMVTVDPGLRARVADLELHDADAEVALQWANLYGGLSVKAPTGAGGALTREQLLEEGARRGLPELPGSARAA